MKRVISKLLNGWATRSLAVGACASLVDLGIGTLLATVLHVPTAFAAMAALTAGSTLNFLGQRRFAFKEAAVALPAARWAAMTAVQIVIHGQLVQLFRDGWALPYPLAKLGGDVIVFGALQLVLLRYVVFANRRNVVQTAS